MTYYSEFCDDTRMMKEEGRCLLYCRLRIQGKRQDIDEAQAEMDCTNQVYLSNHIILYTLMYNFLLRQKTAQKRRSYFIKIWMT